MLPYLAKRSLDLSPVCRHMKRKKVSRRWNVSIALGLSTSFIRQYTLLVGNHDAVSVSIAYNMETEYSHMLTIDCFRDIPM